MYIEHDVTRFAGVSVAIRAGTLMAGFVGLIPCGWLIVSKTPSGGDGFGLRGGCTNIFEGYMDG